MALNHRFDPQKFTARQQKREQVRTNPGAENSIPDLRSRVETLEQALGLRDVPDVPPGS